jgi:hypothetical protein
MSINLLEKKTQDNAKLKGVRGKVVSVTTLVLVVYIVIAAGLFGWEWWLKNQREKTLADLNDVTQQVESMSDGEVLVRKIDSRAKAIKTFLDTRGDVPKATEDITADYISVTGWDYSQGGIQRVQISAGEPEIIANFTNGLTARYGSVGYDLINWKPDTGWTAVISLGRVLK